MDLKVQNTDFFVTPPGPNSMPVGEHTSVTGEAISSGLGVRTDPSIELTMCPFRHTKTLKKA